MANKTTHTLSYKLLMDTKDFDKNSGATKKQLIDTRREMRAMLTPTEKFKMSLDRLGKAAENDARLWEVYNRKLQQYQKHLRDIAAKESKLGKARSFLNSKAGGLIGILGTGAMLANVKRQIDRVDRLAKTSDKLGISLEQLTRIQFTAGKVSGLSAEQTSKAIEKMTRRVSEAAQGTGEAQDAIKEIGLNAKTLAAAKPDAAFLMIARAMDKVTNEGDRVRIATKLFDDEQAGIHTTLKLTNEELQKQFQISDNLGNTLSKVDAQKMSAAKDAMGEMAAAFDGFSTQFAIQFMPALTQALKAINTFIETNYGDGQTGGMATSVMAATMMGGGFTSAGGLLGGMHELATGNLQKQRQRGESQQALAKMQEKQAEKNRQAAMIISAAMRGVAGKASTFIPASAYGKGNTNIKDAHLLAKLVGAVPGAVLGGPETKKTSFATALAGPATSVSAGSSAAFATLNARQVHKSIEVQLADKQLTEQKITNTELKEIRMALVKSRPKSEAVGV